MDLLPALASTASKLRKSSAVQTLRRRMSRRNMNSSEISWPIPMRAIGAQNLLTMPGGVGHSGYLHKKGGSQFSLMKWPLRYIIIHKGCMYYFKSSTSPTPQGAFSLNGYNRVMRAAEETTSSNVFPFKIVHFSKKHRTWYFSAASEDERRKWMRNLRKEIDHYNDRRDLHVPSDSDSDAESFYGSIERTLDLTHATDEPEGNYMSDDDDVDDEEDYVRPDSPSPSTGRPTVPPPSYPPPPVPSGFRQCVPPPVPAPNRNHSVANLKKTPPPLPPPKQGEVVQNHHRHMDIPNKPPPPPPSNHKASKKLPLPTPPVANLKKQVMLGKSSISTSPEGNHRDCRPSFPVVPQSPATLHICSDLERKMVLDTSRSPPVCRSNKLSNNPSVPNHCLSPRPAPELPSQVLPALNHNKPGMHKPPVVLKPPCPIAKPKPPRRPSQSSPDGQSFRSSVDEVPAALRKKNNLCKDADVDSDDDYENVQLPDSVFVDTTETSSVEKLFKESSRNPQDGLYCFRNSGTKTSKVLVVWDVSLGKARNYRLFEEDSCVFLESEMTFPSLAALVEYYYSHPLPNHGSLCLQQPYGYIIPR
ncbi:SH3 domain-binding protein 2 isoform X2 [Esox lucius]|uniref:SH3 domain-binding protein 2 isoform X2 n=1 Tax=Esox lucius TaxID=8010 RepID=UPI000576ABEC|nr:SH3 domain-binding protein 2 isoform X2 [Esox lucius]